MMIMFSALEQICDGVIVHRGDDRLIGHVVIDSRKAIASPEAVFFAINGPRHNGHRFIPALYATGFRQFVVEDDIDYTSLAGASIIRVASSVRALQKLAAYHRAQFSFPVIGVTGSNAKTIIKEWLYQLLSPDFSVVKNPGSYNSQTGVPLSVLQMNAWHQLGIFEAGISTTNEMIHLAEIIRPTIGIFTNIGPAHDEGFAGTQQKIREKLALFTKTELIIYCHDQKEVASEIEKLKHTGQQLFSWGTDKKSHLQIVASSGDLMIVWEGQQVTITLPFSDAASTENACHCISAMLCLGYSPQNIQQKIDLLRSVPMRLELKQGINDCQIIDDTYNNDLAGLQISLDFLSGIQQKKSTVILSDILQSGISGDLLAAQIAALMVQAGINSVIGIGRMMSEHKEIFEGVIDYSSYRTTEEFLERADITRFRQEVILVKGARMFGFEKIVHLLQRKIHGTVMEIDLGAMVHNLNFFRAGLKPGVKLMAMVKAFAYGSGSEEVANLLQYHGIDYLGVAYPDEGIELRKNNIRLPIMVMNPSEESFASMHLHKLEPEIYTGSLLLSYISFLNGRDGTIHIKLDTGMHRLGFEEAELDTVITLLQANSNIHVATIFSHLAGADDEGHDEFTRLQADRFVAMAEILRNRLGITPTLHLLNSSGILRFPEYQFGMVRLGIGLYGIDPTSGNHKLAPAATLKTVISQIKTINKGDTIGYGRKGTADNLLRIATIAIGYADGFSRGFSGGVGEVIINGQSAKVIGNVCMDMTMVDVTNITAKEGDEVIIFGKEQPIGVLAAKINTIPYEILTGTSERVKRVFFAESI